MFFARPAYLIVALALLVTGCARANLPSSPSLPSISYVPLPLQSPVPLTAGTIDEFVTWIATMPSSQIADVKQEIAKASTNAQVVDALTSRLSFTHPGSYDQQLIYLSILGQMRNPRALPAINAYVYSRDCPVYEEQVHVPTQAHDATVFDTCAGLKSQAISMVAFINTTAAQTLVIKAIEGHPSRAVRLSAIDAYLYNNQDSARATAFLLKVARPDDKIFVGLPRLAPQYSLAKFDIAVARFYKAHPEKLARVPRRVRQ